MNKSERTQTIASQLVGVWKLAGYTDEQEGHEKSFPFGPQPEGFLIYTPDGFVSAQLMKPGRSRLQSHDWYGGTPDEYQEAGRGYIAYCGIFEVNEEEETVTHVPYVAFLPNLVGEKLLRSVTLSGDRLTLLATATPVENGGLRISRMEWQRLLSR